ncbi:uncharacterized protein LOC110107069 [Dendrobium catenatum]|uniref:DUF7705 domain-containing protein n=1 Tax=Dendrobium catenatum TaxID=906689 RepID=A0A2I0XI68_9ASPA|nr:uncharacterized protein LOC110107069 [Dendrobium catenatum]PKU87613.1 hypothetical protein MA16_Dca009785 [Dendrobium catenatum]
MKTVRSSQVAILVLVMAAVLGYSATAKGGAAEYVSAVGDPGMKRNGLRVAFEGWNFCNEVGAEAPGMGSPREADCFDLKSTTLPIQDGSEKVDHEVVHLVNEQENKMGANQSGDNVDLYAVKKELYLGAKCEVKDTPNPWHYWMVMLKNGNFDTKSGLCPSNGKKVGPFPPESRFPCFAEGKCMNQPLLFHNYTAFSDNEDMLRGSLYGTYDLDADISRGLDNISYYSVVWEKKFGNGEDEGWKFHHYLRTSQKYPWLMLYLRSDATKGLSGGYHYPGCGMTKIIPQSPDFKVRLRLDIKQGGGPKSQFYLLDMGSCWKNNGEPCDGNVETDVTRYSEMILNPDTDAWCHKDSLNNCPPYHTFPNSSRIHRNDSTNFPYEAYHMYCAPGNAQYLELPHNLCDAYSNPQPQEILQILPHPVWGPYGYPTKKGEGWIGDPKTWELDVGGMSQDLYFYQDPGTVPVKRSWTSLDVGTEIYVSENQVAEWTLSQFDILVPKELVALG